VVDENVTIGNNVQIINKNGVQEADRSDSERLSSLVFFFNGRGTKLAVSCVSLPCPGAVQRAHHIA
jgi:hypothetical protein